MHDEDGPDIADSFYEFLFRGHTNSATHPKTTDAAVALHQAILKLRAKHNCTFIRWVPFIHMGL
jgi:hypothetical protein